MLSSLVHGVRRVWPASRRAAALDRLDECERMLAQRGVLLLMFAAPRVRSNNPLLESLPATLEEMRHVAMRWPLVTRLHPTTTRLTMLETIARLRPRIVWYSGHACRSTASPRSDGSLFLDGGSADESRLESSELVAAMTELRKERPDLTVLMACDSASIAARIAHTTGAMAVGWAGPLRDGEETTLAFARAFVDALLASTARTYEVTRTVVEAAFRDAVADAVAAAPRSALPKLYVGRPHQI